MSKRGLKKCPEKEFVSHNDPQGSWTGNNAFDENEKPVQDADDL